MIPHTPNISHGDIVSNLPCYTSVHYNHKQECYSLCIAGNLSNIQHTHDNYLYKHMPCVQNVYYKYNVCVYKIEYKIILLLCALDIKTLQNLTYHPQNVLHTMPKSSP